MPPLAYLFMSVHLAFQPTLYKEGTLVTVSLSIDIFRSDTEQGTPKILSTQVMVHGPATLGAFSACVVVPHPTTQNHQIGFISVVKFKKHYSRNSNGKGRLYALFSRHSSYSLLGPSQHSLSHSPAILNFWLICIYLLLLST